MGVSQDVVPAWLMLENWVNAVWVNAVDRSGGAR